MQKPTTTNFEPGDVVSFCQELLCVERNKGTSGQVLYLNGELCSTNHWWLFEGEETRLATPEELAPYVDRFPLAKIGMARLMQRIQ